jgi:hypothetical protein
MITFRVTKRKAAVVVALAVALVAAIGVASWQTSGSGNLFAQATTASALVIGDASASTSADLYPGATGSAVVKVTNSNPFPLLITQVTLHSGGAVTSSKGAACDASTGVSFTNQTSLSLALPANTTQTFTLSGVVSMSNASDNSCQGATFTVPVDVTAVSNA